MASKESQVAAQVRLNQWAQEIQDCQNRPKDMTVDEWCKQHNIKKANYYWRLRWLCTGCIMRLGRRRWETRHNRIMFGINRYIFTMNN